MLSTKTTNAGYNKQHVAYVQFILPRLVLITLAKSDIIAINVF